MKRLPLILVLASTALFTTACMIAPVVPPQGFVFTNYQAPLDVDQAKTTVAPKTGEASSYSILFLVAWGDASIQTAAQQGGLQTIESADYSFVNVLGLYQEYTTIVHGS